MELTVSDSADADLIVVGGGLGGLCAAAVVARAGRTVIVLEKTGRPGGRATTDRRDNIAWNRGPHALYCRGQAFRVFRELGVPFTGRVPRPGRAMVFRGTAVRRLPAGIGSLASSRLLSIRQKWRLLRILTTLNQIDMRQLDGISLRDWLDHTAGAGNLSLFLEALCRLSTYAGDTARMSAGPALEQLKLALAGNVWYLDGGWQTLVNGLHVLATQRGANVRVGASVTSVEYGETILVRLANGTAVRGRAVILAVDPAQACKILGMPADSPLARWTAEITPVRAACLDLALTRLSRPRQRFALALDRPVYASVHSAAASLAPPGVAVVHVMRYLENHEGIASPAIEADLENFFERIQPGWRAHVVARRFLPAMTVAHSLPTAAAGGLQGRPGAVVDDRPNVFLAGDWVGCSGLLADATAASASESARLVLAALGKTVAAPRSSLHVG